MNRRDFIAGSLACAALASTGCASRGKSKPKPDYGPMVNVWRGEVNHMLTQSGMGN